MLAFGSTWEDTCVESVRSGTTCQCCFAAGSRLGQPRTEHRVWREFGLPTHEQVIRVLGAPVGHSDFVRAHFQRTADEHRTLLEMIPLLSDVQSAWMMLLHCATARANYHLWVIRPELALQIATSHDQYFRRHLQFRCTGHRQGRCYMSPGFGWIGIVECSEGISLCVLDELGRLHAQTPPGCCSTGGSQHARWADHVISVVIGSCCTHHN